MKVNPGIDFIKRFWRAFRTNAGEKLSLKVKTDFMKKSAPILARFSHQNFSLKFEARNFAPSFKLRDTVKAL